MSRQPWGEWRVLKHAGRLTPEIDAALRGAPEEMCPRINRAIPHQKTQVPDDRSYTGVPDGRDGIEDACKAAQYIVYERDEMQRAAELIADERDEALKALEDCRDALDRLRALADLLLTELVGHTEGAERVKANVMAALAAADGWEPTAPRQPLRPSAPVPTAEPEPDDEAPEPTTTTPTDPRQLSLWSRP